MGFQITQVWAGCRVDAGFILVARLGMPHFGVRVIDGWLLAENSLDLRMYFLFGFVMVF